ncbi:MAG: ABC transporter permease [Eubacteriales bacterium]|nr:ABC transporter permease [Eubacteriales bacterium]
MTKLKNAVENFGRARMIILVFLVALLLFAPAVGVSRVASLNDMLTRFAMNAVLVLSMVPMIQSGCGLNFGVPLGLVSGLLAEAIIWEYNLPGALGFILAMLLGALIGAIMGMFYGFILNRIRGDEMVIATYVGYAIIYFMNMMWLTLPFKNPSSVQGYAGEGLRVTISLDNHWLHVFDDWPGKPGEGIVLKIPEFLNGEWTTQNFKIPVGTLLLFAFLAFLMWLFFRSKTGTAMTAVGSNPMYAMAGGINIKKMRMASVVLSTSIAAVGMIIYGQTYGFAQFYTAPQFFTFPTVAAILLGGASLNKASIANVVLGTFLFQGVLTLTPSVINSAIKLDMSEVIRMIITNGLIIIALTRKGKKDA